MNKQEFISASLPYGLNMYYNDGSEYFVETLDGVNRGVPMIGGAEVDGYVPVIRNISDLTKECVQADYNDGKPFTPIVELAKIAFKKPEYTAWISKNRCLVGYKQKSPSYSFNYSNYHKSFSVMPLFYDGKDYREERDTFCPNQLKLFQQLLKWHFWPSMPEGEEVIYVTDEFNPYK